ncbi:MAG: hypothetical protein WCS30_07715 [Selenomonadaceae bacterium]
MKKVLIVMVFCLLCATATAAAATIAEDFAYKGVALGDSYEKMIKILGEPLYDKQLLSQGAMVTYYTYKDKLQIGVAVKNNSVVDIQIKSDRYEARDGVKLGATPYKLAKVYGKVKRTFINGETYYIYTSEKNRQNRLMLQAEPTDRYLLSIRITSLPITDAEIDARLEDELGNKNDLNTIYMGEKDIDTSRVQTNE